MAGSQTPDVSDMPLQAQLAAIEVRLKGIEGHIAEIKSTLASSNDRVRLIERDQAGAHPVLDARLGALEDRTTRHDAQIAELTKNVENLQQTVKTVTWVCGIAGAAVLTWLIAQLLALV